MVRSVLIGSLFCAISGCTGSIGTLDDADPSGGGTTLPGEGTGKTPGGNGGSSGTPGQTSTGGTTGTSVAPLGCSEDAPDPGPTPLKLLSRDQYLNTVRDLVGDVKGLDDALGARADASEFGLVQPDLAPVDVESYGTAAELIAATVTADATRLKKLAPCSASQDERTCARTFVQQFGALAYRAPLADAADADRHLALYDAGRTTSYAHGIELVLRGVMQAPRFLYRVELGTGEKVGTRAVKLSGYELAARLSYTAWDSPPDDALIKAAESGALETKEGATTELSRLLADAKGKTLLRRFLSSFIHLNSLNDTVKDATLFPAWSGSSLRASMQNQAASFFDDVLANQGGTLASLLTSQKVFVNKDLGSFYDTAGGDTFSPLVRADDHTSGLLTLPAFLALNAKPSESSPIYRGKFVREALLCKIMPAPPANIPKPPDVTPGVSTRERLHQHEVDPVCSGCHQLMDPIGFGFEYFDSLGRYRTTDGGRAVDASGEIVQSADVDGKFTGTVELGKRLAGSAAVEECIAKQWFRFTMSRFEQSMDTCSMKTVVTAFRDANASLNVLPQAIVQSDAFFYRQPKDVADAP